MGAENLLVVVGFLKVMRCQADRQHRNPRIQTHAHQTLNHGLRHEIVSVDAAVNHQRRRRHRAISARLRQLFRHQRQLERPRHVEHIDKLARDGLAEPFQRLIDDFQTAARRISSMYISRRRAVTGPGVPSPTGLPSISTTGMTKDVAEVTKASSAACASARW
jgi:hypothetical protein